MAQTHQPVYVIFGASGGIGTALCQVLQENSAAGKPAARLFLSARREAPLAALAARYNDCPYRAADACQSEAVDAVMAAAKAHYGCIDGVVNLVGSLFLKPPHLTKDADFLQHLATNLHSAFYIVRAASQAMEKNVGGSIVLLSSVAARYGLPNHEVIAAAKGGILGLVLAAAATYAPHNIRINAVAPGLIDTPLTSALTQTPAIAQASAAWHPLGHFGQAADIAATVAFLLDPQHSFITGQVWGVDGGMSRVRPQVSTGVRAGARP